MFLEGKIENFCILLDFDNCSLYSCPFDFIKEFVSNIQRQFNDCRSKIFIINPPYLVSVSWSLVKTLFSEVTNSMILFLNSKNMEALYKEVD